ncbi:MAG: hypothetical protein OEP48_08000 [Betaproteobacteria bacterium]|nr:hypothetical protein [Betaproteobacteria bacterium]
MSHEYHPSYYQQPRGMSAALLAELTKPFHQKLLDEARHTLSSNLNEMAVVLSQAASEMCTEWAITALFALRDDKDLAEPILGLFVVKDICSERVQRVYSALSGDSPNQQPFWARLKSHRDRRNAVVRRGEKASPNEAAESVAVVDEYLLHVEAVLASLQARQSPKP